MALRLIDVLRTLCFICASIPAVVSQTPPFYDTGYNYIRDYIYDPRTEYISSYSDYSAQVRFLKQAMRLVITSKALLLRFLDC